MQSELLIYPLMAHLGWIVFLYATLTVFRAPDVWKIGADVNGGNPWKELERKVCANLSNQFEWPVLFYAICVLFIAKTQFINPIILWAAWLFILGRIAHTGVQVLTANVRLRGLIFTINFIAVLVLWILFYLSLD